MTKKTNIEIIPKDVEVPVSNTFTLKVPYTQVDDFGNEVILFRKERISVLDLESQIASHQAEITRLQEKLDLIK